MSMQSLNEPLGVKPRHNRLSVIALLMANAVPLLGVLLYGWNVVFVLALFWIENLIVGVFNLVKMLAVVVRDRRYSELLMCAFFIVHYGFFCMAHGTLLWSLLDLGPLNVDGYFPNHGSGLFGLFAEGATVFMSFVEQFGTPLRWAILALILSHGVALIENFVLQGGVLDERINRLMGAPYPRIIIMHVGLLVGAIVLEKLGSPTWLLVILVGAKIVVDVSRYRTNKAQL
ncbi:DUF6498-containing protein [Arenicella xantha]|uniref:Uncharacterized protein n=1 Tax=Arenicella xantha TaxID=644221 RepID=A0A395JPP3_9GAMM|nr:DUF6498-containing protein [Arenicella xantha]RBP53620.1 hypothetical protein DFR28_1011007 [Arenicella xantha]